MSTVNVELAEELLTISGVSDAQPSRSASKLIALELFREHRHARNGLAGVRLQRERGDEEREVEMPRKLPSEQTPTSDKLVTGDARPA